MLRIVNEKISFEEYLILYTDFFFLVCAPLFYASDPLQ